MANLKEIRGRIRSVKTTQQMTKAMKMVAAAKLRKAQDNIIRLRPYAHKLKEIMDDIGANMTEKIDSPFAEERKPEKVLLVLITSNRGLCGAFNGNVIKLAIHKATVEYKEQYESGNLFILNIGKKGYDLLIKREFQLLGEYRDVFANLSFDNVSEVADEVMNGFLDKKWDKVDLIYNEFKNVVSQVKVSETFLPISADLEELVSEDGNAASKSDYIFEPKKEEILEELIPKMLKLQFYKSILESNAGEQGARMTAMDNATTNAEELLKDLKLKYNRARQAAITTEILEIVGGAEALASGS